MARERRRPRGKGGDRDAAAKVRILHEAVLDNVERQLASGEPPEAREALERLLGDGLERHAAIRRIGVPLALMMTDAVMAGAPPDYGRYLEELRALARDGTMGACGPIGGGRRKEPGGLVDPAHFASHGGTKLDWFSYELARAVSTRVQAELGARLGRHGVDGARIGELATRTADALRAHLLRRGAAGVDPPRMLRKAVLATCPGLPGGLADEVALVGLAAWACLLATCEKCTNRCQGDMHAPSDGFEDLLRPDGP